MGLDFFKKNSKKEKYSGMSELDRLSIDLEKAGGIETAVGRVIGSKIDRIETDNLKNTFIERYGINVEQEEKKDNIQEKPKNYKINKVSGYIYEYDGEIPDDTSKKEESIKENKENIEDLIKKYGLDGKISGKNIFKSHIEDDFFVIDYIKNTKKRDIGPDVKNLLIKLIQESKLNKIDLSYFCKKYKFKDKKTNEEKEARGIFSFLKNYLSIIDKAGFIIKLNLEDFEDKEIDLLILELKKTKIGKVVLAGNPKKELKDKLEKELMSLSIVVDNDLKKDKEIPKETPIESEKLEKKEEFGKFEIIKSKFAPFEFAIFLFQQKAKTIKDPEERKKYEDHLKNISKLPKRERRKAFMDEIKEAFTGIAVHEKMDLDAKGVLFLCKIVGLNFSKFNYEQINEKGENKTDDGSIFYKNNFTKYLNEDGSINEDVLANLPKVLVSDLSQMDGLNIFKTTGPRYDSKYMMSTLDHHGQESTKGNCATRQMFSLMLKLGLINDLDKLKKENPLKYEGVNILTKKNFAFIKEIVRFINREDDKYYKFEDYGDFKMSPHDFNISHKKLYGYTKFINPNNLEKILNCNSLKEKYFHNNPRIPLEFIELTDEELIEIGLINITDNDLILQYKKQFETELEGRDVIFPDYIIRLEEVYFEEKLKLKQSGLNARDIQLELEKRTGLGWLISKSRKIQLFIEHNELIKQFEKYKIKPENIINSDNFGKIFVQKNTPFTKSLTDLLICNGFDGYINYTGDGKVFFISLFGEKYPEFDKEFMDKLKANGIIKIRGMLIKIDKKSIINEALYNEIIEKIKATKKEDVAKKKESTIEVVESETKDIVEEVVAGPFLDNSMGQLDFLNDKNLLKNYSEFCIDRISTYSFDNNYKTLFQRLSDISKNLISFRQNVQTFQLLSSSEVLKPTSSLEIDGKIFYFSSLLKEKGKDDIILCYVDDGKNVYPRLISINEIGVDRFRAYISKETKFFGKGLLKIEGDEASLEVTEGVQIEKLHPKILSKIEEIKKQEVEDISYEEDLSGDLVGDVINNLFSLVDVKTKKQNPYTLGSYTIEQEIKIDSPSSISSFWYFDTEAMIHWKKRLDEIGIVKTLEEFKVNIFNILRLDKLKCPNSLIPNFKSDFVSRDVFEDTSYFGKIISETFLTMLDDKPVEIVYMTNQDGKTWIDEIRYKDSGITTYGTNKNLIATGILASPPIVKKQDNVIMGLLWGMLALARKLPEDQEYTRSAKEDFEGFFKTIVSMVNYKEKSDYIEITKFLENIDLIKRYKESKRYGDVMRYFHKKEKSNNRGIGA